MVETAVSNLDTGIEVRRGRPANREKHREVVRLSEEKLAENLPALTDAALELALGRKAEICRYHHLPLRCPHGEEIEVDDVNTKGEPIVVMATVLDCGESSKPAPANEKMLMYAIDRVSGRPALADSDRQLQADFIRKTGRYVADVFLRANQLESADERAKEFAVGMSNLWTLVDGAISE